MSLVRFSGARVLVTGAGGFIGSHLVHSLVNEGANVTALLRSMNDSRGIGLKNIGASVKLRYGDLLDASGLRSMVAEVKPDFIFHLGAVVDLKRSRPVADACMRVNVMGTLNLLQALEGISIKNLVFTSTSDVYGENPIPFHEGQRERPASPYAVSKLSAEHLCLIFCRAFDCPVSVLRLSTVYGPGQSLRRFIPSLIAACLRKERFSMGDGEQSRDFVFVRDVVEGLLCTALHQATGEVINLGHDNGYKFREVVELVRQIGGEFPEPSYQQLPQRIDEPQVWSSSSEKAWRLLKWKAEYGFEAGLRETISWYREVLGG